MRWFEFDSMDVKGVITEVAVSDFCWVCGTTCEVWPLSTKRELLDKFRENDKFTKECWTVRAGVAQADVVMMRQQSVRGEKGVGFKVSMRAAFIAADIFSIHSSALLLLLLPCQNSGSRKYG